MKLSSAQNDLGEDRVNVLEAGRPVDDDVLQRELLERALLYQADLVRGDDHVEALWQQARRDRFRAFFLAACQQDCVHVGRVHPANSRAQFRIVDLKATAR